MENKLVTKVKNFTSKESAEAFAKRVNGEVRISKLNQPYVVYKSDGIYRGKKKAFDYDDWWQESNLDGSFAYNGVTDDF